MGRGEHCQLCLWLGGHVWRPGIRFRHRRARRDIPLCRKDELYTHALKRLALILLFASPAYGGVLPEGTKSEELSDFSGGLNTSIPSHKLDKKFSPYLRNVIIDNGKIERPNGYITLGSSRTLSKVTGIFPFVQEDGTTKFLVTDSSITLQTTDFNSWIIVSSASNTGSLLTWMQVRNKMWGFNGVDTVLTWDGTTRNFLNGFGTNPNVPKFKYGAYYQDRVWGFGIQNAASDMYFTSTISTDGVIIAPDDSRAWPAINNLHVGQGDGQIGTALWTYQGLLRAGKERSIYTIYGNTPSSYNPRKEESSVGVISNESVVVMDGKTHLLHVDGVYQNVDRISDLIEPDIEAINKGVTNNLQNTWETQADFNRGQFVYGTTVTATGMLQPGFSSVYVNHSIFSVFSALPSTGQVQIPNTGGDSAFGTILSTETIPSTFLGYVGPVILWASCYNTVSGSPPFGAPINCNATFTTTIKNNRTGETTAFSDTKNFPALGYHQIAMYNPTYPQNGTLFTGDDIVNSNLQMKIHVDAFSSDPNDIFLVYPSTEPGLANVQLYPGTTGQYVSDVATLTSVTAWGNFNSDRNTNGGAVSYYIRTSTSVVNISTQVWVAIGPGSIINAPTINNFIQWASTLAGVALLTSSTDTATTIDNVTISHSEGQTSIARAFAAEWKNRYWLAVTTTSDSTRRLIYIKSKITNDTPNAWMALEGIPVSCFARTASTFYGGSVSTGSVFRLDYGTNYGGVAIVSIYETPDLLLGVNYFDKQILKYFVDGEYEPGTTLTVGTSINGGSFSNKSVSTSGSGRYSKELLGVAKKAKTVRLRFSNSDLDSAFALNGAAILYQEQPVNKDQ